MSALREAAQKALEALEFSWGGEPLGTLERDAILALRSALAEPEQEPVFWHRPVADGGYEGPIPDSRIEQVRKVSGGWRPLYTHPSPDHRPGQIVVTKNDSGQIVSVTRQDSDGRVIEVIAESTEDHK